MKVSLVCSGDYLEFYVEIDFLVGLLVCSGGDCLVEYFFDIVVCYLMVIEVYDSGEIVCS